MSCAISSLSRLVVFFMNDNNGSTGIVLADGMGLDLGTIFAIVLVAENMLSELEASAVSSYKMSILFVENKRGKKYIGIEYNNGLVITTFKKDSNINAKHLIPQRLAVCLCGVGRVVCPYRQIILNKIYEDIGTDYDIDSLKFRTIPCFFE